jgi:hypothetical protein
MSTAAARKIDLEFLFNTSTRQFKYITPFRPVLRPILTVHTNTKAKLVSFLFLPKIYAHGLSVAKHFAAFVDVHVCSFECSCFV